MKERARICKRCEYYDGNALKHWCGYWRSEIGAIITTYGCEKFKAAKNERNLHDHNAARPSPQTRDKGIHYQE